MYNTKSWCITPKADLFAAGYNFRKQDKFSSYQYKTLSLKMHKAEVYLRGNIQANMWKKNI